MPTEVTDPAILAQLNAPSAAPSGKQEVTDPAILAQLNGTAPVPAAASPRVPGNDLISTIMQSFPVIGPALNAGMDALGIDKGNLVQQGGAGLAEGAADTARFLGNVGTGGALEALAQNPTFDFINAPQRELEAALPDKPTNLTGNIERGIGRGVGGAIIPAGGLAKAPVMIEDIVKSLLPAISSGASQGVAQQIAPDNQFAQIIAGLFGGAGPSTLASTARHLTAPEAVVTATGEAVPRKLTNAVTRDQIPLDQVPQRVADLGPAATVADLGSNTQGVAMGLATKPGEAGTTVTNAMKARREDAKTRVPAAVDDTLGPATPPSEIQADIRANKKVVGPEYDMVLASAGPVEPSPIASAIDAKVATIKGPARSALQEVRTMLNENGTDNLDTTATGLFETRNAIDGMISPTGNSKVNAALTDVRQQIDAMLEAGVPGIKEIDAKYRELGRQGDALDDGANVFDKGKEAPWPQENAKAVSEGVQPAGLLVGPSATTFRLAQGARAEIERAVGQNVNDRAKLASLFAGGDSDWNPQKLAQLFGQDKADTIVKLLQNEKQMADTEVGVLSNSKTAAATAGQKDLAPNHIVGDTVRAGGWSPMNAVAHAVGGVVDKVTDGAVTKRDKSIADIIMGNGDWTATGKQPFYSDKQKIAMGAALISAIMQPGGGQ